MGLVLEPEICANRFNLSIDFQAGQNVRLLRTKIWVAELMTKILYKRALFPLVRHWPVESS